MPNRDPTYTVSGTSLVGLDAYVRARGHDLGPAFAAVGLKRDQLQDPESRVELPAANTVWERATALVGDPVFGLSMSRVLDLDAFHLIGHLAVSSRTFGHAIDRIVAFSRLLHDAGRTEAEKRKDGSLLLFPGCRGIPQPPTRHIAEFYTASVVLLARLITGVDTLAPREVRFAHEAPVSAEPHRRLLGVVPTFGAAETFLLFDAATLALPVRMTTTNHLGTYLESYARTLLDKLPEHPDDLVSQVRRALTTGLTDGAVGIEAVAARLGLQPRTLQRRLADDGETFAGLLDEVRREAAEHYLSDDELPLAEISFLLGFQEPSTFHKAFRRWTGVTPGAFRTNARAA